MTCDTHPLDPITASSLLAGETYRSMAEAAQELADRLEELAGLVEFAEEEDLDENDWENLDTVLQQLSELEIDFSEDLAVLPEGLPEWPGSDD